MELCLSYGSNVLVAPVWVSDQARYLWFCIVLCCAVLCCHTSSVTITSVTEACVHSAPQSLYAAMPWAALPFHDKRREALRKLFRVEQLPKVRHPFMMHPCCLFYERFLQGFTTRSHCYVAIK